MPNRMGIPWRMSQVLVLQGHPHRESLVAALASSYADAAAAEGASVRTIHLADLRFDPILHQGFDGDQPLEPDLVMAHEAILAASHVLFAFPTWWAAPPALVKGFVDRTFLPGVAFRFEKGRPLPIGLYAGRSARLLTTMDSPSFWYWWKHGRSTHRSFVDATLDFCGFEDITTSTVYGVRDLDDRGRKSAIAKLAGDGTRDAKRLRRSTSLSASRA